MTMIINNIVLIALENSKVNRDCRYKQKAASCMASIFISGISYLKKGKNAS